MHRRFLAASVALAALLAAPLPAQTCQDGVFRWPEKVDLSLATLTPKHAYVGTMLSSWPLPDLWAGNTNEHTPRAGRELSVYYVFGWVRRIDTTESDCDWHIEITSTKTGNIDNCIVVEIPKGTGNGLYAEARTSFQALLGGPPQDGVLANPVRMEFIGPSFFDSFHRGAKATNPNGAHSHGHCNSSARALWEIHPVYWVLQPH